MNEFETYLSNCIRKNIIDYFEFIVTITNYLNG